MISVGSQAILAAARHFFKIVFTRTNRMREKGKQKESKHGDIVRIISVTVGFSQTP